MCFARIMGLVRQNVFHGYGNNIFELEKEDNEILELLNDIYNRKIKTLNEEFLKNNSKNLEILCSYYDYSSVSDKMRLTRDYYNYVMKRENKNMGFNLKLLRETIIADTSLSEVSDKKYDSLRHKLYMLLDFVLYRYFAKEERDNKLVTEMVDKLRATQSQEEKNGIYREYAKKAWEDNKYPIMQKLLKSMNGKDISEMVKTVIPGDWIASVSLNSNTMLFSKLIYALTLFIDGKEINGLLSELINKFENIASFIEVIKKTGDKVNFQKPYIMFAQSDSIARDIRVIKNFARMETSLPNITKYQYRDAAYLLGFDNDNEIDEIMTGDNKNTNIRNFIINNVIESSRFKYIMRYSNPKNARVLAKNKVVVKYVLSNIPESQLTRYCVSIGKNAEQMTFDDKVIYLSEKIAQLNFKTFENVVQKAKAYTQEAIEKERKKALISLYLTVIYLITKNLVNINSRYVIAMSRLERDTSTYFKTKFENEMYTRLVGEFISEKYHNNRATRYLTENKNRFINDLYRSFRNNVDHLNSVRNASEYICDMGEINSYFEIFHYVVQRDLISASEKYNIILNDDIKKYMDNVKKYHSYSKDFVKVINVPFGYNLARYKNLSIECLFNSRDEAGKDLKNDTKQMENSNS